MAIMIGTYIGRKSNKSSWTPQNAELVTYMTGLTTELTEPQQKRLDTLITSIKTGLTITDLDDGADYLSILGGETSESSLKNIVKDAHHGVLSGTTTFTQSKGFISNGVNGYINRNYSPKNEGSKFTKNNSSLIFVILSDDPNNYIEIGARDGSSVNRLFVSAWEDGFGMSLNMNSASALAKAFVNIWQSGVYIMSRTNTTVKLYKNGTLVQTTTQSAADVPTNNIYELALNNNGTALGFAKNYIGLTGAFRDVSDSEAAALSSAIINYFSNFGYSFPAPKIITTAVGYSWFTSPLAVYNSGIGKTFLGILQAIGTANAFCQYIYTIDNSNGNIVATKVGSTAFFDDHEPPSILIRASDSKLITAFCIHEGAKITYRISTNALDATAWDAAVDIVPAASTTFSYPCIYQAATGDIYIFYRAKSGANYYWAYTKSTDDGASFGAEVRFTDKRYVKIAQNQTSKNIIHFAVGNTPEVADRGAVHHIYFNAGANTWHKSDGTDVTANLPLATANMTIIFNEASPAAHWMEDIILDSNGYPRVLMMLMPNYAGSNTKDLYYTEWDGGNWSTPHKVHQASSKNIGEGSESRSYPPCSCFDAADPDRIFASKEISDGGRLEIFEIDRVSASSFTSSQKTDSDYDQWRPVTSNAPAYNVMRLNKIRYIGYGKWVSELVIDSF